MSRNVKYKCDFTNEAGWRLTLWVIPANDFADRTTNAVTNARVVLVPPEAIDWEAFPTLKRSFGDNTPRPIGMTDTDSMEITWNLDILENAHTYKYPDAQDLVDLVEYLQHPTYTDGVKLDTTTGGATSTLADAGNWVSLNVAGGDPVFYTSMPASPLGGIALFEGVQVDLDEEPTQIHDVTGAWAHTMRVRHWWRVALEKIPVGVLADRIMNDAGVVEGDGFYDQAYHDGVHPFVHVVDPGNFYAPISTGLIKFVREAAQSVQWGQFWQSLQDLAGEWVAGHTRPQNGSASIQLHSKINDTAGAPTDTITFYKRDLTEDNQQGAALSRADLYVKGRYKYRGAGVPILYDAAAPGGLFGENSEWGLYRVKTVWDVVQMCTEQSLTKCVVRPPASGAYAARVAWVPMFDSVYENETEGTGVFNLASPDALTIYRSEILSARGGEFREILLRSAVIGEAESGMNEGSGDDLEKLGQKFVGHEQFEGFNLPFFVHNMPKCGDNSKDKGVGLFRIRFPGDLATGYRGGFQLAAGYEGCLWYRETSPPSSIWDSPDYAPHIRVHGVPDIDIGNGITFQDLTRVALPTDPDNETLPALMAAANLEEQATASWPAVAAKALISYMVTRWQYTIEIDIPAEKALPMYVGSKYKIADDNGNAKGLRLWRDSYALRNYPSYAILVSTEVNIVTGRATCTFYANDYAG